MQALLNTARTSSLYRRQLCLQESQSNDENNKDLLVYRPVVPRPYEQHRPGPDLIKCKDLCRCTSGIMRCIENDTNILGMIQAIEAVGDETEVEVDVWRLRYAMA